MREGRDRGKLGGFGIRRSRGRPVGSVDGTERRRAPRAVFVNSPFCNPRESGDPYAAASSHRVRPDFDGAIGELSNPTATGEPADVVIVSGAQIDSLARHRSSDTRCLLPTLSQANRCRSRFRSFATGAAHLARPRLSVEAGCFRQLAIINLPNISASTLPPLKTPATILPASSTLPASIAARPTAPPGSTTSFNSSKA